MFLSDLVREAKELTRGPQSYQEVVGENLDTAELRASKALENYLSTFCINFTSKSGWSYQLYYVPFNRGAPIIRLRIDGPFSYSSLPYDYRDFNDVAATIGAIVVIELPARVYEGIEPRFLVSHLVKEIRLRRRLTLEELTHFAAKFFAKFGDDKSILRDVKSSFAYFHGVPKSAYKEARRLGAPLKISIREF